LSRPSYSAAPGQAAFRKDRFTAPAVELLAFRDGLIASSRLYFDCLSLPPQIGAIGGE
jgi:hypothetical protein